MSRSAQIRELFDYGVTDRRRLREITGESAELVKHALRRRGKRGRPRVPAALRKHPVNVKLPQDVLRALRAIAKMSGISVGKVIAQLVRTAVDPDPVTCPECACSFKPE